MASVVLGNHSEQQYTYTTIQRSSFTTSDLLSLFYAMSKEERLIVLRALFKDVEPADVFGVAGLGIGI